MKRVFFGIVAIGLLATGLALPQAAPLYITPNYLSLDVKNHRTGVLYLSASKAHAGVTQDLLRGTCYTHQIAFVDMKWGKSMGPNWSPYEGHVHANRPGHCEMWFKGNGSEVKASISVTY